MLLIVRVLLGTLFGIGLCILGSLCCLLSPRNPRNVYIFGRRFAHLARLLGFKVEARFPEGINEFGNCVYIANHQSNYDIIYCAFVVQERTVTVGKKSLAWIPFFGQLYWLTGNILIDRGNRSKAHDTMSQIVKHIHRDNVSIWMFPEGTRSRGRGLMPFKTGAFHAAIAAGVPIVPVCISEYHNENNLNRWHNTHVIVEVLPQIDTSGYSKEQVRDLSEHCRQLMSDKLEQLNAEVAERNLAWTRVKSA
ncbi:MAG: 1-acylglycerol-3-phosphate O-acyltransferase [Enterobacteriaceae bacterium]